jgi:uncharacterized membrane protein YfcA
VSLAELLLLVGAGVGGGLVGSTAGLASLLTYPALLAVGLGAVEANVTNTVALVFASVGAVLGSRPELRGQLPALRRLLAAALAGGGVGALLLLATSADTFEKLVPWLIGGASLAIMLRRRGAPGPGGEGGSLPRGALTAAVFLIAIYGGYFGAAAGVVLLALLLAATHDTLARSNAIKNAILGAANATAALAFALVAPVAWAAVAPLAAGLLVGGRLGPVVVRRADDRVLRIVIGVAGLGLAIKLGADAYG